jgi:hypothetical protein
MHSIPDASFLAGRMLPAAAAEELQLASNAAAAA